MICVKCGREVTTTDTWQWLDEVEVERENEIRPEMRWIAECKSLYCGWSYGKTKEESISHYAENQKWGMERIKDDTEDAEKRRCDD